MPLETTTPQCDTGRGALIHPLGHSGEAISAAEYKILKTCLELYQSEDRQLSAIADTLSYIQDPKHRSLARYLDVLASNVTETAEEFEGILGGNASGELILIRESDHVERAADFLKVLEMRGWFSNWIALQVETIATGNPPPSPLQVMQSLTFELEQFDMQLETARRIYDEHPELLVPEKESHASNSN